MTIVRWIGIPLLVLFLVLFVRWISVSAQANAREPALKKRSSQVQKESVDVPKLRDEYVLEVIGLGVTFEQYRQSKLWEALQKGSAFTSIREQDKSKYAWSALDKNGVSGGRAYDAMENGINFTPLYWGVPSFYAGPPIRDSKQQLEAGVPMAGMVAGAGTSGMAWHLFSIAPWSLAEHPDKLLLNIFEFFDTHPDVPYVVLMADDSAGTRDGIRAKGEAKMLRDGYYIPEMPDTTVAFVLARRERVEFLRPSIWDDPGNKFVQEKFRAMYYQLMESLAKPDKELGAEFPPIPRQPTVAEWLAAAAAFAQRPDIRGAGLHTFDKLNPWENRPPRDWKPTPWFPIPWNREQMETFDRLPSFGFVHRPVFVKFTDEEGRPVTRRDARQKLFNAGWQQALQTLPEAERAKGAARIVAGTGNQPEQLLMLESMLHDYTAQGGPEIDSGKSAQFINTDIRLGNTGAATWFMQMAIGVMGSYRDGGASAAINLRDNNEASIIFITPPSDAKRQQQDANGDIFRSRITPAVDPANYAAPSVEAILESAADK
ncbi:type VI lipase adapter Tla3 domain-containing protein [Janthinobacterium sp. LB3P112]|uniref:type VI lipase adapter Tla3 domain-containing protein n=1 Tax=Janthinobacterium sp. LB3P112 TaxID=3424196 RepID=UPI003F271E5D